jgi:outer membrane lipoprotein-sorting protein
MNMDKYGLTGLGITIFAIMGLWVIPVFALENIDAHQVAVNVDEREDGNDMTATLEMTLTNKRGQQRTRKVINYRKDYDKDNKSVLFFLEPADVKGTGFLSWNYDDESKDDEQWLYLPALKKVRRISSSDKADSFMGTDFTYSDMGDYNIDDYTYKHLDPEVIAGIECYHIERLPKDKDVVNETGYGRTEIWVRPDNWVMVKAVFFDKNLKLLKEFTASDIEQIDGIWTIKTMKMDNKQTGHHTIFQFTDIKYNSGLDDDIFSQRQLTKGVK